jgi:hypothetical protein
MTAVLTGRWAVTARSLVGVIVPSTAPLEGPRTRWPDMKRLLLAAMAAALVVMPAAPTEAIAAPSTASSLNANPCTTKWKVTGKKVAVRRPAWNEPPVATMRTRVDHYLHRGDVVTSCRVAIARTTSGPAYRACGKGGHVWRIVRGGQVPQTCLQRLR